MRNNGGVVIAQVKRLAAAGTLKPHDVVVPGILVDYIVVAPDQLQTTHTAYEPAISGEIFRPLSSFETPKFDIAKVIARRIAQELRDGDAVNIGFGISANVPRILIEEGRHGAVTWVIEQGAVGGVPLLDFQFGCASNAEAIVQSPHQFTYFQGAGFDMSLLSFLQIDRGGSVNVSKLGVRPHVTAGAGGFVDITARAKKIVFSGYFTAGAKLEIHDGAVKIAKEGKVKKLVESVEQISFSGPRAVDQGQEILYVTERCVLRLEKDGVTVTELAPGHGSRARRPRPGRVSAAGREKRPQDGPCLVPRRADQSSASPGRGDGAVSPFVELRFEGPLARLTLKRADKLNALDRAMIDALADAARAIDASSETRAAILSGEGKAFCAGGDIGAWGGLPPLEMWRDWTRAGHRAFEALARLRVPLIAAMTGHAFGGGLELAAVADIRIAESGIKLGLPEIGSRHGAGLVGHAETGAPLRRFRRAPHGSGRRHVFGGRGSGSWPRRRGRREGRRSRAGGGACGRYRQARTARRANGQGDDQRRGRRGSRCADRGPGRSAHGIHSKISPKASPRSGPSARRRSPGDKDARRQRTLTIGSRSTVSGSGAGPLPAGATREEG